MPTKRTLILTRKKMNGTRIYWNPYYHRMEYHLVDGSVAYVYRK